MGNAPDSSFQSLNRAGRRAAIAAAWRVGVVLGLFALFSLPLLTVGEPRGAARVALERMGGQLPDVVITGDSRPLCGVSPTALVDTVSDATPPAATRLTGYNFAEGGTDTSGHWSFVVNALRDSPRPPRLVIWAPDPMSFDGTRTDDHLQNQPLGNVATFVRSGAPVEPTLDLLTMGLFPPYRHRPDAEERFQEVAARLGEKTLPFQEHFLRLRHEPAPRLREYRPRLFIV